MVELRPIGLDEEGIARAEGLLRTVFRGARYLDSAYLDWAYRANPDGRVVGFDAHEGGELVGHFATQPLRAMIDGEEERGVLAFHIAILPEHRGQGLFKQLAERSFAEAADAGYGFVLGVANASSTDAFVRGTGFQRVAPLQAKLGLGRTPAGRPGVPAGFERVWDEETVRWRLACPTRRYGIERGAGEDFRVVGQTGALGITVELGTLEPRWVPANPPRIPRWNPVRLWLGADSTRDWSGSAYVDIPMRLRPSPLNLIFRDLTGRGRELQAEAVRFRALDFDAY